MKSAQICHTFCQASGSSIGSEGKREIKNDIRATGW